MKAKNELKLKTYVWQVEHARLLFLFVTIDVISKWSFQCSSFAHHIYYCPDRPYDIFLTSALSDSAFSSINIFLNTDPVSFSFSFSSIDILISCPCFPPPDQIHWFRHQNLAAHYFTLCEEFFLKSITAINSNPALSTFNTLKLNRSSALMNSRCRIIFQLILSLTTKFHTTPTFPLVSR